MSPEGPLLSLLMLLASWDLSLGCYCDHYPWSPWTPCSKTCNYGTQSRQRRFQYDEHYWKNACAQLCDRQESRACNEEACPVHCQLSEYGAWSPCSPCAKKQFRTRSLVRPGQFGGVGCSGTLMEERSCHPSAECQIERVQCKDRLQCDNGRCISPRLRCNGQNDCGDDSDERHCPTARIKKVCVRTYEVIPGADLMANGFDAVGEQMRAAVLDSSYMGEECVTNRSREDRKSYRIPGNVESVELKVEMLEDFKAQDGTVHSEPVELTSEGARASSSSSSSLFFFPIIFATSRYRQSHGSSSFRSTVEASQKKDSKFIRVHQLAAVSTFWMRQSDLVLSLPFMSFLNSLPLDYSYAMYRQVFQVFGTHYFGSGTLGGVYDLLYQYDREELKNSGSFLKAAEKSISMVKGGRTEYAAALAWERQGAAPSSTTYKDWLESTKDHPAIVEYELLPILDLVRGFPCAVTKRRHLERALLEYLEEVDSCKCAPCPNNARPVLSRSECLCVCQTGTYGPNCEKRAPDYTSEAVDGRWSCWGAWSGCDSSMKRHRVRECNNPAPMRGGRACPGSGRQEEGCYVSIFQKQDVCINDDDFEKEDPNREEPGSPGCLKPRAPANSYLRLDKKRYDFGEQEEVLCYSGFEMQGYQYIRCLPGGAWSPAQGHCLKKVCLKPSLPDDITPQPRKEEYKVGDVLLLGCARAGMVLSALRYYTCGADLAWEPPLPADMRCVPEHPFVPDESCSRGEKKDGSQCVCYPQEECRLYSADLCVLDAATGRTRMESHCALHAGQCRGEPLFFLSAGGCPADQNQLDWARFRASLANQSLGQEACGPDTCYDWETCHDSRCECKLPRDCSRDAKHTFCLEIGKTKSRKSLNVCFMAAMKCARIEFELVHQGPC